MGAPESRLSDPPGGGTARFAVHKPGEGSPALLVPNLLKVDLPWLYLLSMPSAAQASVVLTPGEVRVLLGQMEDHGLVARLLYGTDD